MKIYTPMTRQAWEQTIIHTENRFKTDVLGDYPTKRNIRKETFNTERVNFLQAASLLLLFVLLIFTALKSVELAMVYTDTFTSKTAFSGVFVQLLTISAYVVFMLILTSGVIFFTLQSSDKEILEKQHENPIVWRYYLPINLFRLNVLTPRLYPFLTYGTIFLLCVVSLTGVDISLNVHSFVLVFVSLLPVAVEVALAHLVSQIITQRQKRQETIHKLWVSKKTEYDVTLKNKESHPKWFEILYREIIHTLVNISVTTDRGKKVKPNLWLIHPNTPYEEILEVAVQEYKRFTTGAQFASAVLEVKTVEKKIVENNKKHTDVKPKGDKWTKEEMVQWFVDNGYTPEDNIQWSDANAIFAHKFGARTAWRDVKSGNRILDKGANKYFKVNHEN